MEIDKLVTMFCYIGFCCNLSITSGSKTPRIESFRPHFGPMFGGTLLEVRGQNLNIGNRTSIFVAGNECSINNKTSTMSSIKCYTRENTNETCGNVEIYVDVDDVSQNTSNELFCYKPNPVITKLAPLFSIQSGGTTLTISGTNLDSMASSKLAIVFIYDNINISDGEQGNCSYNNKTTNIICLTPKAHELIIPHFINKSFIEAEVQIKMDDESVPMEETIPKNISIYRDPHFDEISSSNILLSTTKPFLSLKGQFILEGINKSDIKVMIGGQRCPVTKVDADLLQCDARDFIDRVMREQTDKMNETEGHDSKDYSTTPDPNVENKYVVNINQPFPSPTSTFLKTTVPQEKTTTPPTRTYDLKVEIGHYKKELGKVTVVLDSEVSDTFLVYAAVGGGVSSFLIVLLFIAIARLQTTIKTSSLKTDQITRDLADARLAFTNGESSSPSLKQILESVVDADAREDMDKLIIALDKLTVGKCIGAGNFGCVFEGVLETHLGSPPKKVAIKTLQDPQAYSIDLLGFVQEAVFMKDFQHPNVLGLVGLAEKEPGVPYVILPFMEKGDLLTYVRDAAVTITLYDVIKFGADIANGMAYLSSLKFVHRDLAARNCMLDSTHCVKVADFGLCRDIYEKGYYTSDNKKKLPIRWMALESIEHGAYSTKSDVWSLGIVLWEMLTRGLTPYPGVDGWDVVNFLRQRRLPPPYFCPEPLYNIMMVCWAKDPNQRPDFQTIQRELMLLIEESAQHSSKPETKSTTSKNDYVDLPSNNNAVPGSSQQKPDKTDTVVEMRESASSGDGELAARPKLSNGVVREEVGNEQVNSEVSELQTETSDSPVSKTQIGAKEAVAKDEDTGDYALLSIFSKLGPKLVKNVTITIPESYSDRDVNRSAIGIYVKLVGNYEPPRKFSSPFRKLTKKYNQRKSERLDLKRQAESGVVSKDSNTAGLPNTDLECPAVTSTTYGAAYFELEPRSERLSKISDDGCSSARSSYSARTAGSVYSVWDAATPGSSFRNVTEVSMRYGSSPAPLRRPLGTQSRPFSENKSSVGKVTPLKRSPLSVSLDVSLAQTESVDV